MTQPIRIQRKRTKGFNLQAQSPDGRPVVSVCQPGKWGNPFVIIPKADGFYILGPDGKYYGHNYQSMHAARAKAVREYGRWLGPKARAGLIPLDELRGKHLACFCGPKSRCHADVLLELANA